MYWSQESHYPCLKRHENEEKIDIDRPCLENDHIFKTAQPISMILVSFFPEYNVLSDEIKICYIFDYQSNENWAFRSWRDRSLHAMNEWGIFDIHYGRIAFLNFHVY